MRTKLFLATASVGAAAGFALYFLVKKPAGNQSSESAGKAVHPAKKGYSPVSPKTGSYSFISGFKDSATVEMALSYDTDAFDFHVSEDEFLTESSDSHVGILSGELFSAQFEYAAYYAGENFEKLTQELSLKHKDLMPAVYGALSGMKYRDGDNLSMVFPIPEDPYSYLHVTLVKAKDNDDELESVADYPDLGFILSSIRFSRS